MCRLFGLIAGTVRVRATFWLLDAPDSLHVRPDLSVHSQIAIPQPPAHLVPLPADNPNIDT